ncbi:NAD-dependent epimerase/dehydratase family protein [Photobacterium carnosum]|uniref:NAD-dependent epimerase/dehydratase family protein n=1 Tax=Photobacterium carnosum TaxID=2023717 RepID=UPI001E2B3B1A|nr:NAD-dependent epimerase/dehydratase family protein [Photobacterium carnosum]MCD9497506.1 NAD-dependent epimerase/dehydratase family protein [Photobacterium carnosum]MCD9540231.1 NAD-dependent epimerase/dehydratase family protein [Photobacterium carnosum]
MKVSICGCGWLGLPLALSLKSQAIEVWGSKTTIEGANVLQQQGINSCLLTLPLIGDIDPAIVQFLTTDVLIIAIPPGRKNLDPQDHIEKVMSLATAAKKAGCQRIIFISTTSVYDPLQGEVLETTPVNPSSASGQLHYALEQQLRQQWQQQLTVLRLSGLIGPQRHPVTFLSGRRQLSAAKQPVNLVHLDDCIGVISAIIKQHPSMPIMHLAASTHPTREQYYTAMAIKLQLPLPEFGNDDNGINGKEINSNQTIRHLGIVLQHDDLLQGTPQIR